MAYPNPTVTGGLPGSTYQSANGATSYDVTGGSTTLVVTGSATQQAILAGSARDSNGVPINVGAAATTVTDSGGLPTYLLAGGSDAFINYKGGGAATIDGGSTSLFVGEAIGVTNAVTMYASNGENAQSYLFGGDAGTLPGGGFGTVMYGAVDNRSASAVLTAGQGATQMFGGIGHTTMFGSGAPVQANFGEGAAQVFSDGSGAADTIFGGTGGDDLVILGQGGSSFDDRVSGGDDKLQLNSGTTTVFGASGNGTAVGFFGTSTLAVGDAAGAEQIYDSAAGTNSVITLASGDTTQAASANAQLAADKAAGDTSSTVVLKVTGGTNSVTVDNLQSTTIKFG